MKEKRFICSKTENKLTTNSFCEQYQPVLNILVCDYNTTDGEGTIDQHAHDRNGYIFIGYSIHINTFYNYLYYPSKLLKIQTKIHINKTVWIRNSRQITETSETIISFDGKRASLIIKKTKSEHSGTYKVVFKNSAGSDESSAELNVTGMRIIH